MWNIIASGVTSLISGWFETKKQKQKAEADFATAQLNSVSDYDNLAQKNMQNSWKDEYLILIHTFPWWGYIIPSDELTARLDLLWAKMDTLPEWWWYIYLGMVISTFGLRWMIQGKNVMSIKRGDK